MVELVTTNQGVNTMIARETKVDISFFTAKDFLTERSARLRRAVIGGPLNATLRIQSFWDRPGQK